MWRPRNGENPKKTPSANAAAVRCGRVLDVQQRAQPAADERARQMNHLKVSVPAWQRPRSLPDARRSTSARSVRADADARERRLAVARRGRQPSAQPRPDREEQLVVVAAGHRLGDGIRALFAEPGRARPVDRHRLGLDHGADAAGFGDPTHAVGQPVAQIDARGRGAVAREQPGQGARAARETGNAPCTDSWRPESPPSFVAGLGACSISSPAAAAPMLPLT